MLDEVTIDRRTHDVEPGLVVDHFNSAAFKSMQTEIRRLDDGVIVGRWWTDPEGPYALVRAGSLRIFRAEKTSVTHAKLHYLLTRSSRQLGIAFWERRRYNARFRRG